MGTRFEIEIEMEDNIIIVEHKGTGSPVWGLNPAFFIALNY
jgi:hypothetical protein